MVSNLLSVLFKATIDVGPLFFLCAEGQLQNTALQLGAEWRWTFDDSCTHFIYQVSSNEIDTVIFTNNRGQYMQTHSLVRKYSCKTTTYNAHSYFALRRCYAILKVSI